MVIWWLVTISSTKCISPSIYFYSAKLLCQASEKLMVMNGKPLFVYCQLSMTYRIIEPIFSLFLSWINGPTSIIHKNNQWKPWLLPYHRAELPLIKNGIWGHETASVDLFFVWSSFSWSRVVWSLRRLNLWSLDLLHNWSWWPLISWQLTLLTFGLFYIWPCYNWLFYSWSFIQLTF